MSVYRRIYKYAVATRLSHWLWVVAFGVLVGAPVRLRVPTQLGYKSAKWVQRIEVVGTFAKPYGGNGGYWEDLGYEWYAGI